jgi:hypothetical protein
MIAQRKDKLNPLQRLLPSGLLATAGWLGDHEYPSNLLAHYASRGWLESPARGVYRIPGPPLKWQAVVASLQLIEGSWSHVGGLKDVDLGKGKRALFPRGKLDSKYQITRPADLDDHAR